MQPLALPPYLDSNIQLALEEFIPALRARYGDRLERVVLFGSQARNEGRADSDVDMLVILDQPEMHTLSEINRQSDIVAELDLKHRVVLSAIPLSIHQWHDEQHALVQVAKEEGVVLWEKK
mgnify:CR=1 FL=1